MRLARQAPPGLSLTRDPIGLLVRRIAVPAGVGLLFHTLFNVVDTWFAGLWSTQALAALAVSFPIFFIVAIGPAVLRIIDAFSKV